MPYALIAFRLFMKRFSILALLLLLLVPTIAQAAKAAEPKSVTVTIKGMYCASCADGIRAMLKRTPGVTRSSVSYAARVARVDYDGGKTSPAKIVDAIEKLGYQASIRK